MAQKKNRLRSGSELFVGVCEQQEMDVIFLTAGLALVKSRVESYNLTLKVQTHVQKLLDEYSSIDCEINIVSDLN